MPFIDSIDKIVTVYFASVCSKPFCYKGQHYKPKHLVASPLIFRGYSCPQTCGGCCPRFTLDYLPSEERPYFLKEREIIIDGRSVSVLSDLQNSTREHHCRNLDKMTGRCLIYLQRPFSCDFELIRFLTYDKKVILTQKLFGRGWAMLRVDGNRGAMCEMLPPDPDTVIEVVRKLNRLKAWAGHFGIETKLDSIIAWAEQGPRNDHLYLD